jgi:hypothetical protein
MEITEKVARKVLETVDAGLVSGVGIPQPGQMCVEAAVCYALGLPHGDDPECVSRALRTLKIKLNDASWSSDGARAKGLRRLALAQLGSWGAFNDAEFVKRCAGLVIRKQLPAALRAAATVQSTEKHRDALIAAAERCEREGSKTTAAAAADAAHAAKTGYSVYAAAAAAVRAADAAYVVAAAAAAAAAAHAAQAAADAADQAAAAAAVYTAHAAAEVAAADAARAAVYASYVAAAAAVYTAHAAAEVAAEVRDTVLAEFAEDVVQILVQMKAPGCQWLAMTE